MTQPDIQLPAATTSEWKAAVNRAAELYIESNRSPLGSRKFIAARTKMAYLLSTAVSMAQESGDGKDAVTAYAEQLLAASAKLRAPTRRTRRRRH